MRTSTYLVARGWREEGTAKEARWWPPAWLEGSLPVPHDERTAAEVQREIDAKDVAALGSVKFVATKEQEGKSPLLALATLGAWTEKEVIDRLIEEGQKKAPAQDELARVLAHIAGAPARFAPLPPPGARDADPAGCLSCRASKGYHFSWCAQRGEP